MDVKPGARTSKFRVRTLAGAQNISLRRANAGYVYGYECPRAGMLNRREIGTILGANVLNPEDNQNCEKPLARIPYAHQGRPLVVCYQKLSKI